MTVFRFRVGNQIGQEGVYVSEDSGERREVDGLAYVKTPGGWMQPAGEHWHGSRPDALRAAADEVAAYGRRLLAQAERLREEADRGQG